MKPDLLDTSAILTLRDDEPGADRVAELLSLSQKGQLECFGCFICLMEVPYRVWRDEGEGAGRLAYEQCLLLPIVCRHETPALPIPTAEVKARYPLSLADAWIAACAMEAGAIRGHKDPEFKVLALEQHVLPCKGTKT